MHRHKQTHQKHTHTHTTDQKADPTSIQLLQSTCWTYTETAATLTCGAVTSQPLPQACAGYTHNIELKKRSTPLEGQECEAVDTVDGCTSACDLESHPPSRIITDFWRCPSSDSSLPLRASMSACIGARAVDTAGGHKHACISSASGRHRLGTPACMHTNDKRWTPLKGCHASLP